VLARTTTLYVLLEEYPFLREHLRDLHPAFARLASGREPDRWARVVSLGELATAMDLPWPEFLHHLQEEIRRTTGVAPPLAASPSTLAPGLADDLRSILREFEAGASLASLAERLEARTRGLDAESVAAFARAGERSGNAGLAQATGQPVDWPPARLSLSLGHPVRRLLDESARIRDLVGHAADVLDGVADATPHGRWRQARPVLDKLLGQLQGLDVQRRRLRVAWRATLVSRGGQSVAAFVDAAMGDAEDALTRARTETQKGDRATAVGAATVALGKVRSVLVAEEELLAPAALRWLDDDDWEAVAEQERLVGPALAGDQVS
jgi:hypothetical protein